MKRLLFVLVLALFGCNDSRVDVLMRNEPVFPKRAATIHKMQRWPLEYLVQQDLINGNSPISQVKATLDRARAAGYGEWADRVLIVQTYSFETVPVEVLRSTSLAPWFYREAVENPDLAIQVAVYENAKLGCDWMLHDKRGRYIAIWPADTTKMNGVAINLSTACPSGRWDGKVTINGKTYDFGDTRGKTAAQWISTTMRDRILLSSKFLEVTHGIMFEDGPFVGVPSWILDMTGQEIAPYWPNARAVTRATYEQMCKPNFEAFVRELAGGVNKKLMVYANGHWCNDAYESATIHRFMNSGKLEKYGGSGTWPHWDNAAWFGIWPQIEASFAPYQFDSLANPMIDRVQGSELAIVQCAPKTSWTEAKKQAWARQMLAHAVLRGGYFSLSWFEDPRGLDYIRGEGCWPMIDCLEVPEVNLKLGRALGGIQAYGELYYRRFENYTVVLNLDDSPHEGIPGPDAVWVAGAWSPRMSVERIER